MTNPTADQLLDGIDLATLIRRVRCLPGLADAQLVPGWTATRIGKKSAGNGTVGIFRFAGEAAVATGSRAWSMVLKMLDEQAGGFGREFNTPATELAAYRSGLFEKPGDNTGFRAATCYGIDRTGDTSYLLWLEDVTGAPTPPWTDELYVSVARHIGQFNGHWATRPAPSAPWLAGENWKHGPLVAPPADWEKVRDLVHDPMVGPVYGTETIKRASQMGSEVASLVAAVENLPVTVCHSDCHPKNLLPVVRNGRHTATVAIDWASVSPGPLGVDSGPLLGSGLGWTELGAVQARRIERQVFESYLHGLSDAGWRGDADAVRLTYLTSLAADYGGRMALFALYMVQRPDFSTLVVNLWGKSEQAILTAWKENLEFMFPLMDEALRLAGRTKPAKKVNNRR